MILEWLMSMVAGLWQFIGDLVPDWDVPAALTDPGGMVEQIVSTANGVGVLLDWPVLTALALAPLAVWVIGLLWKIFRMFASHLPFIGGNG